MLHIPLNQHLLPSLTPLGHLSVQMESLNGTTKRQKSSKMNWAAGFCKGNWEEWRQHCLANLNSAILCAHPHSSNTVFLQKEGKNTVAMSMQLAAGSPAILLVQDYATAPSTIPLPSDYNLSNIHPVPQPSGGTMSSSKNLINNCGDYLCVRTESNLPRLAGLN